jgi:hypothetical protein
MKQFSLIIPKEFILSPYKENYSQIENPISILVNYRIVFGEFIEVMSLEIPFYFVEMLDTGKPLNAFIQDAAHNNNESLKENVPKRNFDQRLKDFANNIDDLKDIEFK